MSVRLRASPKCTYTTDEPGQGQCAYSTLWKKWWLDIDESSLQGPSNCVYVAQVKVDPPAPARSLIVEVLDKLIDS